MFNIKFNNFKSVFYNFFTNRFNHSIDSSYAEQWRNRFKKPIHKLMGKMDNYSRLIFFKVIIYKAVRLGMDKNHLHELREFIELLIDDKEPLQE